MTSNLSKILTLFLTFTFIQSFFRSISTTYNYYLASFWGDFLKFNPGLSAFWSFFFALLFALSIMWDKRTRPIFHFLREVDFSLLLFSIFFGCFMFYNVIRDYGSGTLAFTLSLLTLLLSGMVFWEVLLRIKEGELHFIWLKFFKEMADKRRLVIAMILPLSGIFLYFFVSVLTWFVNPMMLTNSGVIVQMPNNHTIFNHLILSFFLGLLFAVLTFLMDFILKEDQNYEQANQEKLRAERFKAELITNMSHDLKTPLTSLINYVDLLKKLPIEDIKVKEYTEVLDRKSLRLKHLITDLLEASKIGTGNIQLNFETINVSEMLGQVSGEFEEEFLDNQLKLILRFSEHPYFISIDSEHFWRVIENLLSNCLKYSLKQTRVFLEIGEKEDQVNIQIKNTSKVPIDIESSELTEQFIRGDRARLQDGHGLGLYISKNLVELMGGQFKVEVNGDLFSAQIIFNKAI